MYLTHTMQQRQQTRKTPPTKKKMMSTLRIDNIHFGHIFSFIYILRPNRIAQTRNLHLQQIHWLNHCCCYLLMIPTNRKTKTNVLHTLKHDSIRVNSFHCHCTHDVFFLFFFFLLNIFYTFSFFLFYWFKLQTLRVIVARPHYDLCWHFYNKIVDLNNIITARN